MAQVQLGIGDYGGALNAFAALLESDRVKGDQKKDVIKGFLDAAASKDVTPRARERRIAMDIYRNNLAYIEGDAIYLARLGWVLQKVGQPEESTIVLEKAVQQQPNNAEIRNQLAFILINSGNMKQAAEVLAATNLFAGKRTLAGVYMKQGELQKAEEELRRMLREYPVGYRNTDGHIVSPDDYREIEMMLGNALTSLAVRRAGETADPFGVAISHWLALDRKYPNDKEIPTALGNAYLWSAGQATNRTDKDAAYTNALKQYQKVLTTRNFMPGTDSIATPGKVEQGFIDAAASSSDSRCGANFHRA